MKKIKPHGPLPSQTQLAYLGDELAALSTSVLIPFMTKNGDWTGGS